MKIINFSDSNTIVNQYVAELRDVRIQGDRNTFRHNLERIGQLMKTKVFILGVGQTIKIFSSLQKNMKTSKCLN